MSKSLLMLLLFFTITFQLIAPQRLIDRNSTDPLEMAIERALVKLYEKIPEKASITIQDVNAFNLRVVDAIYEHFEHILMDIGFSLVDRNSNLYVRSAYYDTDEDLEKFLFIVRATDKDIVLVFLEARTGETIGYAIEHF
ncbi:MAG: hypothetical protein FWG98_03930 [Candidatus Cloacimonetes bacterium]|nr:hypothetical protein [Candidatus Cloacimonadota bacterium]